jgi:hypothetical protein
VKRKMGIGKIRKIKTIKELFAYMEEEKGSFPDVKKMEPVSSANFRPGIKTRFVDPAEKKVLMVNFNVIKAGRVWEISEKKPQVQKPETPVQMMGKTIAIVTQEM